MPPYGLNRWHWSEDELTTAVAWLRKHCGDRTFQTSDLKDASRAVIGRPDGRMLRDRLVQSARIVRASCGRGRASCFRLAVLAGLAAELVVELGP